ncbi:DUF6622 family protein [Campylobacter sp. MOP7]|uniref:DUF6622 family protein n=1 Tax=Campylobacter canis TaxID=3378588 RepID=UPI00387E3EFE
MNTITEAILHTPWWAFAIFIALIFLGYKQSFDRKLSLKRAVILPIVMLIFSIFSLVSSFGLSFYSFIFWLLGITLSVFIGFNKFSSQITQINPNLFLIKGSFLYMALMIGIFFTKYTATYVETRGLEIFNSNIFISALSFMLGGFSGVFLARILAIWNLRNKN